MSMRLGLATANDIKPDILIIYEFLSFGDESFQNKCMTCMMSSRERGIRILFVIHSLNSIKEMSDRAIKIEGKYDIRGDWMTQ